MIRPLTFICLIAAFGSGLYLYSEKHKAVLLDRDIAHAIHATEAARERTGLLRAEWALLNDPGRLQDMADKYLALKPMAPGQFVQLADLSTRLPPPAPPGQGGTTDDGAAPDAPADPAPAQDAAAPAPDAAPDASAALVAKAEPAKPAPVHAASKLARAAPRKPAHPTALARSEAPAHEEPLARSTPLPLAGIPQSARVMSAMARPVRSMPRPAIVTAYPTAIGPAPYVGSALGGGTSLPPPVPLR
jgi:hypothetical protein